jgi:polysaccharide biosynthesis/export protein
MTIQSIVFLLAASAAYGQQQTFAEHDPRYKLQPNDIIEIQYRYTPEFNQTATVQPDGFVTLQVVGDIKFAGLSVEEAKAALLEKARARLRDPEISIVLKEFQKPYFIVSGQVQNPGRFDFRSDTSAMDAIAIAGGFKPSAQRSHVVLFRRSNPRPEAIVVNIKKMLKQDSLREDPMLRPGDLLWIPENTLSDVAKWVHTFNAGTYINPWPRL